MVVFLRQKESEELLFCGNQHFRNETLRIANQIFTSRPFLEIDFLKVHG